MVTFRFDKEYRHWALRARKHCILCKALSLIVHKIGIREVSEDVAREAEQAGAGERIQK